MFFILALSVSEINDIVYFKTQQVTSGHVYVYAGLCARVYENIRGTVQADILKEDQAQNTCIFSIDFALRMMGDVQAFFVEHGVRNYYSVSVRGYHIAEAGANPITQLAFTLQIVFLKVARFINFLL